MPVVLPDPMLTPAQVAELLGIEVETVWKYVELGRFPIPAYRVLGAKSRALRFRAADVRRLMEGSFRWQTYDAKLSLVPSADRKG